MKSGGILAETGIVNLLGWVWALWQTDPANSWRLDPARVYGNESTAPKITEDLQPWAGGTGTRPWAAPDNQQLVKTSLDPSVVKQSDRLGRT